MDHLDTRPRALRFAGFGPPDVLSLASFDPGAPAAGQALVGVRAASINPSDVKNVAGRMHQTVPPRTPGRDFAGVVLDGPADWVGAHVWGTGGDVGFTRDGTHAERLLLPVAALSRMPDALDFAQAGAVGVNYVTAWLGLRDAALASGETLVVIGATGGVGGAASAIGTGLSARVIAACRTPPAEDAICRLVGAAVIPADPATLAQAIRDATDGRGADVIYDTVGDPALAQAAIAALGVRGRMVVIAGTPGGAVPVELIPFYRRECRLIGVDSLKRSAVDCASIMDALRPGFQDGRYPPPAIAHRFSLHDAAAAYRLVGAGTRGRVVLTMEQP